MFIKIDEIPGYLGAGRYNLGWRKAPNLESFHWVRFLHISEYHRDLSEDANGSFILSLFGFILIFKILQFLLQLIFEESWESFWFKFLFLAVFSRENSWFNVVIKHSSIILFLGVSFIHYFLIFTLMNNIFSMIKNNTFGNF